MSGRAHQKQTYNVPRPLAPEYLTARARRDIPGLADLYLECDDGELSYFICQVARLGYAASFSQTSDGGALSISVYDGYTRFKGYIRKADDFADRFTELLCRMRGEE